MDLPNRDRNKEVDEAISVLKGSETGDLSNKPSGIANSLASLNIAESLQTLQLQIVETSRENRIALTSSINKLIISNDDTAKSNIRHSKAMNWLTAALVFLTAVQVILAIIGYYQSLILNRPQIAFDKLEIEEVPDNKNIFKISLKVKNLGNLPATDLNLQRYFSKNDHEKLQSAATTSYLLGPKDETEVLFLLSSDELDSINYDLPEHSRLVFRVEYSDINGNKYCYETIHVMKIIDGKKMLPVIKNSECKSPYSPRACPGVSASESMKT